MPRHAVVLLCALLGGCALGPGGPFATLEPTFEAVLVAPEDRALPGGWQQLNTNYQARFTVARVDFVRLELLSAAGAGGAFDPANPPPGYSLCHGGHCHRDDGALIPYEDIAAELGGGGGARTVARMPVGTRDLLAGGQAPLGCANTCDLPSGDIARMRLGIARVRLEGFVRDSLSAPRLSGEVPFLLDVALSPQGGEPLPGATIDAALELPVDRKALPRIGLDVAFRPTGALLDGVDWAAVPATSGVLDLSADPRSLRVLQNLERSPFGATVSRSHLP